jgi:hypothetical protein
MDIATDYHETFRGSVDYKDSNLALNGDSDDTIYIFADLVHAAEKNVIIDNLIKVLESMRS